MVRLCPNASLILYHTDRLKSLTKNKQTNKTLSDQRPKASLIRWYPSPPPSNDSQFLYPPGGGHSHKPVYIMHLSRDPLFCICLSLNAPFQNLTPNDPLFLLFDQNFLVKSSNFGKISKPQQKFEKKKKKIHQIDQILCNLTTNDPFFF